MKNLVTLSCLLLGASQLGAQCISDACGDIFADFAILSQSTTICEGVTFEVENQTTYSDIDYYVWDWGNGDRDTVFEVGNQFYTYYISDDEACASTSGFVIYNISLEIFRNCENGQSCHSQTSPVAVRITPRAGFNLPVTVCADQPITIQNETCGTGRYEWLFPDGSTSTDSDPVWTPTGDGEQDIRLIVFNECGADTVTQSVLVGVDIQAVGAVAGTDTNGGCGPTIVELENNTEGDVDFYWDIPSHPGISFLNGTTIYSRNPVLQFNVDGDFTIRLIVSGECSVNEWETTITTIAQPTLNLRTIPDQCLGAVIDLAPYANVQGDFDVLEWRVNGPNDFEVISAEAPVLTLAIPGVYTVTLTGQRIGCSASRAITSFQVQAPPQLSLSVPNDAPICTGSSPVTISSNLAGGVWSGLGVNPSTGLFQPSVAGAGMHTIHYDLQSGPCAVRDSVILTVLPSANAVIAPVGGLCSADNPIQLAASPMGGSWFGTGIVDSLAGTFDPSIAGAGNISLQYVAVDNQGCVLEDRTTIEVSPSPSINTPTNVAICVEIDTIDLNNFLQPQFQPQGGTATWSGMGIEDGQTGIFIHNGVEGNYTIQLTYQVGNCQATTAINLQVGDTQTASVGPDRTHCISEDTIQLSTGIQNGVWSGPNLVDNIAGVIDLTSLAPNTYSYIYEFGTGTSCAFRDTLELTVVDAGTLNLGFVPDICPGQGVRSLPTPSITGGAWQGPSLLDSVAGWINIDSLAAGEAHTYTYSYAPNENCAMDIDLSFNVRPYPEVAINVPSFTCVDIPTSAIAVGADDLSYNWTLDGAPAGTSSIISVSLNDLNEHNLSLLATDIHGCQTRMTETLVASSPPTFDLIVSGANGCTPLQVSFGLSYEQSANWQFSWDLGNGASSTGDNPGLITYQANRFDTTYQVNVVGTNVCGTVAQVATVDVQAPPVASFGTQLVNGCSPLEVQFANTTQGEVDSYSWNLGNNETYIGLTPPNQFYTTTDTLTTSYEIILIAENACGSSEARRPVTVEPAEVAAFFSVDEVEGCQPLTVNFADFSTSGTDVFWRFGDGTTAMGDTPTHVFDTAGVFVVEQIARNGCTADTMKMAIEVFPQPDASFTHPEISCFEEAITFTPNVAQQQMMEWSFGDGDTSRQDQPAHTYSEPGTYTVSLLVREGDNACAASYTSEVLVPVPPSVSFTVDKAAGCPPLASCFTAQGTGIAAYNWTFTNRESATGISTCANFNEPGRHFVRLQGTDRYGCASAMEETFVEVFETPKADFILPDATLCGAPQLVRVLNNSSGASTYTWQINDQVVSEEASPAVNFAETGEQRLHLTAVNAEGCTDEMLKMLMINPVPIADFGVIVNDDCAPQDVVFENFSSNADSYTWLFGNGQESLDPNPVISFNDGGNYDVRLVAGLDGVCFDTLDLMQAVRLNVPPTAAFSWSAPSEDFKGLIEFRNESLNAAEFVWNFGDGGSSTQHNPIHDFMTNDRWSTTLLAIAANGCTDEITELVDPPLIFAIHFPNAFSPETGDGEVRIFKPKGIGIQSWTLEIFTPWSELVYTSTALDGDQPAVEWDGMYKGKILPQGAYAYKADVTFINGVSKIYTGSVTILR